jgi:CheY-like chemotaxis protein
VGIPAVHLEKIFEEFWRAPGAASGTKGSVGLGLSIVRRICRLLGTEIVVQSTPGKGSVFSLELPSGDSAQVAEQVEAGQTPQAFIGFNRCIVVVVDDNQEVLRSMARLLQSWDCQVIATAAVEEALTTIIDQDITPGLLLTDFHLGSGSNGISAISAINAEIESPAPAIMISSDNSASLRDTLDRLGIPLLTKPVDPARLRAAMQHLLARPGS